MTRYNLRGIQCTSCNLKGGMVTNPWKGPCYTCCYLLFDLAKFEANGGAHQLQPRGTEHGKITWGKHHMKNLIIFKIQWKIAQCKRSKRNRLNIDKRVQICTYKKILSKPPFL
jgi:hypothetical protein